MARKVPGRFIARNKLALAVAAALVPFTVAQSQTTTNTLPTGGQVAAGSAAISQPAANKLQIDQASDKAVLNWQSFSIGSGAWVNFTQPSASAIALNRVMGTNPSEIFGRLTANGQVFLSNPNGVLFAPGASVDVGALFATTLSISDSDFMAGRYNFYNAGGAGSVVNQGSITAGGYAALAGPQVRNDGIIVAQSGTVALAAADRVSLDMVGDGLISISVDQAALNASAINSGTLQADGGRVVLTARSANALLDTVVNNSGVIRANSLVERNGEIVLDGGTAGVVSNTGTLQAAGVDAGTHGGAITVTGDKVAISSGGVVDASGDSGGGSIAIGRGASATFVGSDAVIRADATGGGNGGSVETSGAYLELGAAPQVGDGGTWVIDPYNIQIVAGTGATNNTGTPNFTPNGDSSQIGATLIVNQLNAGASVVVDTGGAGSPGGQLGDLTVSASIIKTNVNAAGLTLNAANNLDVNAPITLNAGAFHATAGHDMTVRSNVAASNMNVAATGALTLDGGGLTDAQLLSSGGQIISASSLALRAQNNRRATIQNTVGDQSVTVGAGGIDLNVVGGAGVAQIASNNPNSTTTTTGTQTVSTTGVLNVLGGSIAGNNQPRNSGIFQNQTGKQTVTAAGITLQAATAANAPQAGAFISTNSAPGGADQEINVAAGTIAVSGGGIGLQNRASIVSSRNQTINGNADIFITGGTSGTGTNDAGTNNRASIAANNGTQTIFAHDITLKAGTGGTDTSATISGATQSITASGDVRITGGSNDGDSNGARIGASEGISTNLTLQAHNVTLTGGATDSGAAIGNSKNSVGLPGTITITASGDVSVNSGDGNGARIGAASGDTTAGGSIKITAAGGIALNGGAHGANIRTADDATLTAANISETGSGQILVGSLAATTTGAADLGGTNTIGKVTNLSAGGTLNLNNVGTLTLDATNQNAAISSTGGQTITADGLVLHAENDHAATITNTSGNQSVTAGAAGISLEVVDGRGVAQVVSERSRTGLPNNGTQTVSTTGALNAVGGSMTTGATNSGVFQNQSGKQTVTAGSISLQAANAAVNGGGAFISNTTGGGDQEVNVAAGTISLKGGGIGLSNRAGITTNGNQTINGNADITVEGGDSGIGTNAATATTPANSSNAALISIASTAAGKTQTINAHNITLKAGSGGTDTFAAITSNSSSTTGYAQVITATGDVSIAGGANSGDSNGARIGAGGGTSTGTNLKLGAHDVSLKGGTTDSGAAIGNSANSPGKPNTITISASGKVELNGGDGNGARIGSPNGDTGGGSIDIEATGNIALNGGVHAANIRTGGDLKLHGASISETGNTQILANSLTLIADGSAELGGGNQISVFNGTSGTNMLLNNSGPLSITNISAGGTLTLTNAGALTLLAAGTQDALVTSVGGQAVTADSISLIAQSGRRARLTNNGFGDQVITATAGDINLIAVNGAGTAKIVEGQPGAGGIGNQTVSAAGALNVQGGNSGGTSIGLIQSGVFQNTFGTQTVSAASISVHGSDFVDNGAALITNQGGGGDQHISSGGAISVVAGSSGSGNRAGILTNGDQTISAGGTIALTGGANGFGSGSSNTSNSATIAAGAARAQTIQAGALTLKAGDGGVDTFAAVFGGTQNISVSGDVTISGGGAVGSANGARIGGASGSPTHLTLSAQNLRIYGGTLSGAGLGGSPNGTAQPNNISVDATGDVELNALSGAGVRIGSTPINGVVGGDIFIHAGGNIGLNGVAGTAAIRTIDSVTLQANGSISETGNSSITAGSLTTGSGASTMLGGPNQVSLFSATSGGDVLLNNSGALQITGLTGTSATVTNAGSVNLSASTFLPALSLTTTGIGSDVLVTGNVFAGTGMDIDLSGTLTVLGATPGVLASLSTGGAQNIDAAGLAVVAQNGGSASLSGGSQSIVLSGGSVDVVASGHGSAQIIGNGGPQTIRVVDGDHFNVDGVDGAAFINNNAGVQIISLTGTGRNALTVGSAGALGSSQLFATSQVITAGAAGESGSIGIVGPATAASATISTAGLAGGTQTIATSGQLTIAGGSSSTSSSASILHGGSGEQSVSAGSISITGGGAGNRNAASLVSAGGGDQLIDVAGDFSVTAGSVGIGNRANVSSNGNQAINVGGDLVVTGGAGGGGRTNNGTSNGAFIQASNAASQETINARNITLNGGLGGSDTFASITAANQTITASEDVRLNGGSNISIDGSGARIGGLRSPAGPTNLTLKARDVVLTGGTAAGNGAALGNNAEILQGQTIVVEASRDVILASGTGAGARIGANNDKPALPGDINITAGRDIKLSGVDHATTIRTTGSVDLTAGGAISEASKGSITANVLMTSSTAETELGGDNVVSSFNATSGGDVLLNSSGALDITGLTGMSASVKNAGQLTWSASSFLPGSVSITTSGAGSDLLVTGNVFGGAGMDVNASGALTILAANPGVVSGLSTGGAQTVHAGSLGVTAQNGGFALLAGGASQSIDIVGGSVDVQSFGGNASISSGGPQTIAVLDGDHFNVNGAGGFATVGASGALQTISLTGSGRNAITVGSTGALGGSQFFAANQSVTAGGDGEAGSIDIVGSAQQSALAGFVTNPIAGGAQTISTSGALTITGGSAAAQLRNFPAGIFHNGSGLQTVNAGSITIVGGTAGNGNAAAINSNGGGVADHAGDQVINVAGDITIKAGSTGSGNRAGIQSNGNQTINAGGDITVSGGDGGAGRTSDNTSNGAFIIASNAARSQTISGRNITLSSGAGGNDTFASITAATQTITASEDVRINGGSNVFVDGSGSRIGGLRVPGTPTNLTLTARDVVLTGGDAAGSGAALGASVGGTEGQTIVVNTSRDVILAQGTGSGARIGTSSDQPAAPGDITINAGRDIQLNGVDHPTTIRTAGDVALNAGGTISEASNGFVVAHALTTTSAGSTLLGGPNQVSLFNATSTGGSVLLTNTGALEVTGLNALGDATLDNTGNVTLSGPWTAGGTTTITVHSDLSLLSKLTSHDVFLTATSGSIQESWSGAIDAASLSTSSVGDTTLSGANTVSSFSASSSTGGITLNNSGALTVTSLQATGAIELTNDGALKLDTPVDTTGLLTLASHGDLKLTDSVNAGDLVVRSLGGNVTIGGADLTSSVVLHGTRSLTLEAPGQVLVRGSDCTAGAGAYALSDGALTVNAGSFSLVGGAAPFAPAVAAGNVVDVSSAGNLTLTGGSGSVSPALLLGGSNISLTVGGTLKIDGGAGDGSFARVQTATRDGEIHITFTNAAGDYVVDGLDGRIKHGEDGFYTGIKPAKPGDTFFVSY